MQILAKTDAEAICLPAGIAYCITGILRAFPRHAAQRQLYVPGDILERHQVSLHDLFAGRSSAGLNAALAELRDLARSRLRTADGLVTTLPREAIPALLPLALVRRSLDRLDRSEPFAPAEIPPWRRQWLLWRAAHNPARLAG
jgi:phytoene synthase